MKRTKKPGNGDEVVAYLPKTGSEAEARDARLRADAWARGAAATYGAAEAKDEVRDGDSE
jgi:hypothetical protein